MVLLLEGFSEPVRILASSDASYHQSCGKNLQYSAHSGVGKMRRVRVFMVLCDIGEIWKAFHATSWYMPWNCRGEQSNCCS